MSPCTTVEATYVKVLWGCDKICSNKWECHCSLVDSECLKVTEWIAMKFIYNFLRRLRQLNIYCGN